MTGLITGYNESDFGREVPTLFERSLKLDVLKKEMVFDFQRRSDAVFPLIINGQDIENVQSLRFHGTTISASLKWDDKLRGII